MDGAAQPPPRLRFADWAAIEEPLLLVPAAGWTARHGTIRLGTDGLHDSPLEGNGFELVVPRHDSRGFLDHPWYREGFRGIRSPLTRPSGLMQARLKTLFRTRVALTA